MDCGSAALALPGSLLGCRIPILSHPTPTESESAYLSRFLGDRYIHLNQEVLDERTRHLILFLGIYISLYFALIMYFV